MQVWFQNRRAKWRKHARLQFLQDAWRMRCLGITPPCPGAAPPELHSPTNSPGGKGHPESPSSGESSGNTRDIRSSAMNLKGNPSASSSSSGFQPNGGYASSGGGGGCADKMHQFGDKADYSASSFYGGNNNNSFDARNNNLMGGQGEMAKGHHLAGVSAAASVGVEGHAEKEQINVDSDEEIDLTTTGIDYSQK